MHINTDINILGGLPDWRLINYFYKHNNSVTLYTSIKTIKSIKRFEKAINNTLLSFKNDKIKNLFNSIYVLEGISRDTLLFLFWNASINNDLMHAINTEVYFEAFYRGRVALGKDEVLAYLNEMKNKEVQIKKWGKSTLETTASKYLTLLKKFNLVEGKRKKSLLQPFLSDKMFVLFIYWINEIKENNNLLQSEWRRYSFLEKEAFINRIKGKKLKDYFEIFYTGDKLKVETKIEYEKIYDLVTGNRKQDKPSKKNYFGKE